MSDLLRVDLPSGAASVSADWVDGSGRGTIVIAHGAGAGKDHPFLVGFAQALSERGFSTLRFNFPYAEAGRRMPGPAPHAIATWRAAVAYARDRGSGALWAAGKSYGGRMASMAVADGLDVDGLVHLGYPLHPPGSPEKVRSAHLPAIAVPQLFIEGTNDAFIQPREQFDAVIASCRDAHVRWVEGGGHSFEVKGRKRPPFEVGASLAPWAAEFIEDAERRGG